MAGSALLVDLYELTMGQSYLDAGLESRRATFSLFVRRLPEGWRYLVAAGLEAALAYLEELAFADEDIAYLESTGLFTAAFLDRLRGLQFRGDVRAIPAGTFVFPDEPLLEVTAPVIEAQLAESVLLNRVHLETTIASKAARCVDAAAGRLLVDFSLRRTHGADAAMKVARASYLAGFDATSNVLAGREYGIPIAGTMAHSFIEAFDDELTAFRTFARSYPDDCTLLIDTYDTLQGARNAAIVAGELAAAGRNLRAVRLDSGDLVALAREVREILGGAGFPEVQVFASGALDEHEIARLLAAGAPIDGFGVGSKMGTSADAPFTDMVYKLVDFDGRPVLKLSAEKSTWPGAKQVWRVAGSHDVVGLDGERGPGGGTPLLEPVMIQGRRLHRETLAEARARCAEQRTILPGGGYGVRFSEALIALRDEVASRR